MPTSKSIFYTVFISGVITFCVGMFWWGRISEARISALESQIQNEQAKTRVAYYQTIQQDTCGPDCKQAIQTAINMAPSTAPSKAVTQKIVSYLTISSAGVSTSQDWSDVPGTDFTFNKNDFPGLTRAIFEANLSIKDSNGTAFARVYDVTHGIAVDGSEISTISSNSKLTESLPLNFFSGKNTYRIQIKSLTGYEAKYWGGRIALHVN